MYLSAFCSFSWHVHDACIVGGGSSGGQREMPGIRFGMASNDGSWFAAFRRGTPPGRFASCDLYPVYSSCPSRPSPGISRDVCGYLTRENNLRGYIVLAHSERGVGRGRGRLFRRERRQILPSERILKSRLNDFHGTRGARRTFVSRQEMERCSFVGTCTMFVSFVMLFFFILPIPSSTYHKTLQGTWLVTDCDWMRMDSRCEHREYVYFSIRHCFNSSNIGTLTL